MHFAYPPRKTSNPPPFAARSLRSRTSPRTLVLAVVGGVAFIWLLVHLMSSDGSGSARTYVPPGTPKAVVVTVFDTDADPGWKKSIMDNRIDYAARHGYATFFPSSSDYMTPALNSPKSWSILPALRHAMTLNPHTPWLFHLAPSALIMAPQLSLESQLTNSHVLETQMLVDVPVVPPDSVIHTFSHLRGENIDFIVSQDTSGLGPASMLIRTGEWAQYFLDAWYDPLYRTYNFQKAERHALEHLVQWHGTILARLALVPQKLLNSYVDTGRADAPLGANDHVYTDGDFIANFEGCAARAVDHDDSTQKGVKVRRMRNECDKEQAALLARWREMIDREGRS